MTNLSVYQNIIHNRTYAGKHNGRMEKYAESVDRYIDYIKNRFTRNDKVEKAIEVCRKLMHEQSIVGSMRLFFSAGKAVDVENAMAFNCKYQAIDSIKSFADLLYSLLCTCGVGISVQSKFINQLPSLPKIFFTNSNIDVVEDTRSGWAWSLNNFIKELYQGRIIKFDTSKVREHGAPLLTSGGYASGPLPLLKVRTFILHMFRKAVALGQTKLKPIQVHDICCMIADCAVQGGVRRAALISLFDENDEEMIYCKTKENLALHPYRYNSNNSMVYFENKKQFKKAWKLTKVNGEPGYIFYKNIEEKMEGLGRVSKKGWGVNPCGEIIIPPNAFCNLVEKVCRPHYSLKDDMTHIRYVTILALLQATLTDYGFISDEVTLNQENDPVIGVSLTGLCDCQAYTTGDFGARLRILKNVVDNTVEEFWKIVGLKSKPKANTCVKPSGTVSQLVGCSSGIHPRYSKYYMRRVLIGTESPLYDALAKNGISYEDIKGVNGRVFKFAMKSPENSLLVENVTARQQLEYVNEVLNSWCDHNPSCTVYVREHEWEEVENILIGNHKFIGLSFLPETIATNTSGFLYLPYDKIDKATYEKYAVEQDIEWSDILSDDTKEEDTKEVEICCGGGNCHIS